MVERNIDMVISRTFGIDKNALHRVLLKQYCALPGEKGPSSPTLIAHRKDGLRSADLFRCESILLPRCWALAVMDPFTRRVAGLDVQCGAVDGPDLGRMFNGAISGQGTSLYVSTDHDPLFEFHRWKTNLRRFWTISAPGPG
jgi:putative transposase